MFQLVVKMMAANSSHNDSDMEPLGEGCRLPVLMYNHNDEGAEWALAEIVSRKKVATTWMYYVHYVDCKLTMIHKGLFVSLCICVLSHMNWLVYRTSSEHINHRLVQ